MRPTGTGLHPMSPCLHRPLGLDISRVLSILQEFPCPPCVGHPMSPCLHLPLGLDVPDVSRIPSLL